MAAQEAAYARAGFRRTGASVRLEGRLDPRTAAGVRDAGPGDAAALAEWDGAATGHARGRFIRAWTAPSPTRRTVVAPEARAFATIRRCRTGCKIGPVVASDVAMALGLIASAAALFGDGPAIVDVPEDSALGPALVAQGFEETFRTARMYLGSPAQGDGRGLAIASMELG